MVVKAGASKIVDAPGDATKNLEEPLDGDDIQQVTIHPVRLDY